MHSLRAPGATPAPSLESETPNGESRPPAGRERRHEGPPEGTEVGEEAGAEDAEGTAERETSRGEVRGTVRALSRLVACSERREAMRKLNALIARLRAKLKM